MRDVAALAGVGIKTVSRVVNDEPNVSKATIDRVRSAITRLNYQPDVHAGNLRRTDRRTQTIGLLVGSVANPFASSIHRAIEDFAATRGVSVIASSLDDDPARERAAVEVLMRRRVDGLIITPAAPSQAYLLTEQQHGTPLIFVDREPVGIDADTVVSDNSDGAALATRHLIGFGHRRIAYLGDRHDLRTAQERRRGFLEELGRAGIATGDIWMIENLYDERLAEAAVRTLMASASRPTAIFSAQNLITVGAIRALRALSLHRQIALVGFDDVELGDLLEPGITVIAQDVERIGTLAAERMFARLDGDASPLETHVIRTRLIERGSGEIPAG